MPWYVKKILKVIYKRLLNTIPQRCLIRWIYERQKRTGKLDSEMLYVTKLMKRQRRFVDIGANIGIYSYHFKDRFQNIDAFEPLNEVPLINCFKSDSFRVHSVALSNDVGILDLNIPISKGERSFGLASLEQREGEYEVRSVSLDTLDNFHFDDVDLIKIDVEGHEEFVLEGAIETIRRTSPVLIIEIEQRHIQKNINDVFQSILNLNYKGFFLSGKNLLSLREFDYGLHQKPFLENVNTREYINNFIFLPNDLI